MYLNIRRIKKFFVSLLFVFTSAQVMAACLDDVSASKILEKSVVLDSNYANVPSTINCAVTKVIAEKLICTNEKLALMELLDAKSYVYALESATGSEAAGKKAKDIDWINKTRNKCSNEECLCNAFKTHTTDLLGGSPYKSAENIKAPVLSAHGYGIVTFGSKLSSIEKKLSETTKKPESFEDLGGRACHFVTFKAYPEASFMVEDGIVTRADVTSKAINALKITIGTPLEKVIASEYEAMTIKPHQYDYGHYLIFKSKDEKSAIVLEEVKGKVVQIRGGLEPSVEYVEGCL